MRACDPHGRCELEAGAALCRCDAGWTGARCDEHAREAYDRVLVSIDLADPAALVLDDGRVLFSGTRGGRTLPLIERFRVYYTSDGAFRDFAESEYDGHSDDVFIELLGGAARRSRFDGTSCRRAPSTRSTCGERTEPGSRRVRAPRSYEGHWATTTPDTAGPRQPMCPSRRSPR